MLQVRAKANSSQAALQGILTRKRHWKGQGIEIASEGPACVLGRQQVCVHKDGIELGTVVPQCARWMLYRGLDTGPFRSLSDHAFMSPEK